MAASAAAAAAAADRGAAAPGKRQCLVLFGAALLAVTALAGPAAAAEYKVGDDLGWTTRGSPNYTAWAASKTFHVGDIIIFEYNAAYHNVLEVRQSNYNSCGSSNPIATYTSGNDSITLKTVGNHYFLCGFTGHCASGQKVDVNVLSSSVATPASSPSAPSPSPSSVGSAPAPSAAAPSVLSGHHVAAGCAVALLAIAMSWAL